MKKTSGSISWFEAGYILLLLVLLVAGVRWMSRGRVGVVDVARVADELGMQPLIAEETMAMRQRVNEQSQTMRRAWESEMQGLRQAYEDAGDDTAERERLRDAMRRSQAGMEARIAGLRQELQQQQRGLIAGFRGSIAPAVRAAAREARADVILEVGPMLLYRRDSIDLTDAVIRHGQTMELSEPAGGLDLPAF